MNFLTSIQPLIGHYGYFGVFLILCLEMIGIPFPAETTLILSGIAWKHGTFHFLPLLISGFLGDFIGSIIAYSIGRFLGRPFLIRFQKIFRMNDAMLDRAQNRLLKAKIPVLLISKFIAGIRIIVPYLAGINRLPFSQFLLWNAISTFLWVLVFITFGQTLALIIKNLFHLLVQSPILWIPTILIIGGLVTGYIMFKQKRGKLKKEIQVSKENESP